MVAHDDGRPTVDQDEDAIRQIYPLQIMEPASVRTRPESFAMQLLIHRAGVRQTNTQAVSPCSLERFVGVTAAFGARSMSGSKRDRFVMEEEVGIATRLPLLAPSSSELQRTGDPEITDVKADDLPAVMQNPAIAGPRASQGNRDDLS